VTAGFDQIYFELQQWLLQVNTISGFAIQQTMLASAVDMPLASADRLLLVVDTVHEALLVAT
jgi:hypothetical protein